MFLHETVLSVRRATVRLVLHSNSAVNIFIYTARLRDFRDAFRHDVRHVSASLACCRHCLSAADTPVNDVTETEASVGTTMVAVRAPSCGDTAEDDAVVGNDSRRRRVRSAISALYALTMTLDRDRAGRVQVVGVKTQTITDHGSIVTLNE